MKIKINKSIENDLIKANRSGLVKVAVQVNSRHGAYQSHRWKNPSSALNLLENDLKKQGINKLDDINFKNKASNKLVDSKELINEYKASKTNSTLRAYVKQNYSVVKKPNDNYNEVLVSHKITNEKITDKKYSQPKVNENIQVDEKFSKEAQETIQLFESQKEQLLDDINNYKPTLSMNDIDNITIKLIGFTGSKEEEQKLVYEYTEKMKNNYKIE